MARSRNRNSWLSSTLKDYIVPIIWWIIIILILWSILGGDDSSQDINTGWEVLSQIEFTDSDTAVLIEDTSEKRTDANDWSDLKAGETIIVREWTVLLNPQDGTNIHVNRVWEFQIKNKDSYALYSSDAWIESDSSISVSLRYLDAEIWENSTISLTQNEAVSTVYVLAGSVKVTNLWWVSTSLSKGQKISVARQDAAKDDIDLSNEKTDIDSYFKTSDWFIDNEGYAALEASEEVDSNVVEWENNDLDTEVSSLDPEWSTGRYLSFENLSDEMNYDISNITIRWTVLSESVSSIELWWNSASIESDGTFEITLPLPYASNDIIVKVFDTNSNSLEKTVYTIYGPNSASENATESGATTTTPAPTSSSGWWVNFSADATDFGFTAPSVTGKFSTTGSEITIRWITTADNIDTVTVNGFELASFNGSTWRYHAFTRFNTLQDGTNQYKVNYIDASGSVVYTDYYTIVKSAGRAVTTPAVTTVSPNEESTEEESNTSDIPSEDELFSE